MGTTDIIDDNTGAWSITLNPNSVILGNGLGVTFTLLAVAIIDNEQSEVSGPITLTIDCPVPPPVITQPDTQDCVGDITISGTAHPETDTVNLFIQGGAQWALPISSMTLQVNGQFH